MFKGSIQYLGTAAAVKRGRPLSRGHLPARAHQINGAEQGTTPALTRRNSHLYASNTDARRRPPPTRPQRYALIHLEFN